MWSLLWILVIPGFFCVLILVVARLEKRVARPYTAVAGSAGVAARRYLETMSEGMIVRGFSCAGLGEQKSKMIDVHVAAWLCPDQITLALTGAGTVLKSPTQQTWLYSQLPDGTYLVTTDANDAGDLSGLYRVRRYVGGTFEKLYAIHRERLAKEQEVSSWPADVTVESVNDISHRRARQTVERGRAYWVDGEERFWRHTWWGSVLCCWEYLKQLGEAVVSPRRLVMGK